MDEFANLIDARSAGTRPGDLTPVKPPRDYTVIHTLERGLRILEEIVHAPHPLRVNEIARKFDIDKASAHRFLATLDRFGLVEKNERTKEYGIGPKFLTWMNKPKLRMSLVRQAKPFLAHMASETGQEAHLGVLADDAVVLVDTAAPASPISVRSMIGMSEPLHCTALGKAILAFLPAGERDALLDRIVLTAMTTDTITDHSVLRRHLEQVRRDGIATDDGEHVDILTCFASPIIGKEGRPLGSMGVSLIRRSRDKDTRREAIKAKVGEIAVDFSRTLAVSEAVDQG